MALLSPRSTPDGIFRPRSSTAQSSIPALQPACRHSSTHTISHRLQAISIRFYPQSGRITARISDVSIPSPRLKSFNRHISAKSPVRTLRPHPRKSSAAIRKSSAKATRSMVTPSASSRSIRTSSPPQPPHPTFWMPPKSSPAFSISTTSPPSAAPSPDQSRPEEPARETLE